MTPSALILALAEPSAPALVLNVALLLLLVALSGIFSGSETVLFSLTRTQLLHDAQSPNRFRRHAARLMKQPKSTLRTILVGNTATNVLLFALSFVFFRELAVHAGAWVTPVSGVFSVLIVVVFGEVVPKVVAVALADRLAPYSAAVVWGSGLVLAPIGRAIDLVLVEPITRVFLPASGPRTESAEHDISTVELKSMLELSRRRGIINPTEDAFVREVLDLHRLRVRDVMVPRVEVRAYDVDAPPDGLRELMRESRRKKIPVYEGSIDNLIGLVYAKMLFLDPGRPIREMVMPVHFVPELINCEQLLHHFRETRSQFAIAVDEYAGMAGVVTLEDVLEEIVGEIESSADTPAAAEIKQISSVEFDISGRLSAHYWTDTFGGPRANTRVATVGGLVTARLGRPAKIGDVVRLGNLVLEVTAVGRRRIERIRLRLLEPALDLKAPR